MGKEEAVYKVIDAASIEGRRKPIARELGAQAIKLNRFDSQPHQEGFAHDERDSGQEEIYVAVDGDGLIRVGAEEIPLEPGRFVLVTSDETRQVVAGPYGLAYVVVGAVVSV
jgi:quercetin dioxygenase-like cupin family protein